jgi:foldase protein PrsA
MRNVKLLWGIIGVLLTCVAVLSFITIKNAFPYVADDNPNNPAPKPEQERIVASVGNRQITSAELQQNVMAKYASEVLNQMLDREVIRLEGDQRGIKVDRTEIDNELKRMQQGYVNEADFYKAMKEQLGMTQEQLREDVYYKLLSEKLAIQDIHIPDEWVDEYITNHPEEFRAPVQLRIQQIVVATNEQAAKVLDELKRGADFAQLAKDRSLDDATRNSGGDLGWVDDDDPFVPAPVLKAAKELKKGEVSRAVEVEGKFVVVKLKDRKEQAREQFASIREQVRKELALHEADPIPEMVKKLRDKWNARILDPEFSR